jgi:hypothetical protein
MIGLDLPGVTVNLLIGATIPTPASSFIVESLESIEITHSDESPCGFHLTFNADRSSAFAPDYKLLLARALGVGKRVIIIVTLSNGVPRVLSDGFIDFVEMAHSKTFGTSTISMKGLDVGVKMDMDEISVPHPALGDAEIVTEILMKYMSLGVTPVVMPTPTSVASDPLERTNVQAGTDRAYINQLAGLHGYIFMIRPGPAPMQNTAYWGPPPRVGAPQPTLCMDMGPMTNVNAINFSYNGLAPTLFMGSEQDAESELDVPVDTLTSLRPPLSAEPAVVANLGFVKTALFNQTGMTAVEAMAYAQGMTDVSTDNVVTGSGDLDTVTYGAVMSAPGLIALRGAGLSFDGLYLVKSVSHSIKRGEYKQQFTLAREGLMPLSQIVPP